MNPKAAVLDLVIGAMQKLNAPNGERKNVQAFIESCYGARVRSYDLSWAGKALKKLTEQEQNALITWTLLACDGQSCRPAPGSATK